MNMINNSEVLGSLGKDLVLNTLGKIYVRVGDRYYELDFHKEIKDSTIQEHDEQIEQDSDFLIVKSIDSIEFPGDNKFIISLDGRFYITQNGRFKNVTPKSGSKNNDSVSISLIEDANIIGQLYSDNLIIDFSSGEITAEELTVDKLKVNSIITESLEMPSKDYFVSGSGKMYIGPEIFIKEIKTEDGFTYFYTYTGIDESLFPLYKEVTDETESFTGEIVEVTNNYIKVRLTSGELETPDKLILKGDYIINDSKWNSIYNKLYNIRYGELVENGDYSDLEFATVSSDIKVIIKSGTIVKAIKDCNLTVEIDGIENTYNLKSNTLYLVNKLNIIPLTNIIHVFDTKKEFEESELDNEVIVFIKETEQIYYKGILIGNKNDKGLPDNFKIDKATEGALIIKKDGFWQPTYDYVTYKHVDDRINELLNQAPAALDTLGEIAAVLQSNVNSIGDIINAINEISKRIDEKVDPEDLDKIYDILNSVDLNNIVAVLDTKATWEELYRVEARFSDYVTPEFVKANFEIIDEKYQAKFSEINVKYNSLTTLVNNNIAKINNNITQINSLKAKDNEFLQKLTELQNKDNEFLQKITELQNKNLEFTTNINDLSSRISTIENAGYATMNWVRNNYVAETYLFNNYYTADEVDNAIAEAIEYIDTGGGGSGDGSDGGEGGYITESALGTILANYYTKTEANNKFALKGESSGGGSGDDTTDMGEYVTKTELEGYGYLDKTTANGLYLKLTGGTVSGDLLVTGKFTHGSDIRYKTILNNNISESIDTIANAPLFDYTWDGSDQIQIGTSAQYWLNTEFKNAVKYNNELDVYSLDYGGLCYGIGIENAKHVLMLKQEISDLKEELRRLKNGMR